MTQPKILVVDDDPASLALVKAALSQGHYENVDAFISPIEAQKSYREKKYDVLITDLRMPRLSGFDILAEIKEIHNHKPSVIVLTAQAEADSEIRALKMGAKKVFFKPYKVSELLHEVGSLLATKPSWYQSSW